MEGVPTDAFHALLQEHVDSGWVVAWAYDGFDAWIDYGRADLRRGRERLVFEWDNWLEGTIIGGWWLIRRLAERVGRPVSEAASVSPCR